MEGESWMDEVSELCQKKPSLIFEELWDTAKALLIGTLQKATGRSIVVISGRNKEESRLFHDLPSFTQGEVYDFPSWETLPSESLPPSPDVVGERYQILHRLQQSQEPMVLLAPLQACLQKLIKKKRFGELCLHIQRGEEVDFQFLLHRLEEMGYVRAPVAADKGEYAVRGGIVDLFPVNSPDPYRLEFWGDEVEEIRTYDPVGQTSVSSRDELTLLPAVELELIQQASELETLFAYFPQEPLVVFDDLYRIEERLEALGQIPQTFSRSFLSFSELIEELAPFPRTYFSDFPLEKLGEVTPVKRKTKKGQEVRFFCCGHSLEGFRAAHGLATVGETLYPEGGEELFGDELLRALGTLPPSFQLRLVCGSQREEERLKERLSELEVSLPPDHLWQRGSLSQGWVFPRSERMVLPAAAITQVYPLRRQKQRSAYHTSPAELYQLNRGDAVVHLSHGVGVYQGVETRPNAEGVDTEYFLLEYANQAKLYVPLTQSQLVSKFVGNKEERPKLSVLGSGRWKRTKEKTESAIMGYASDLLRLYAQRSVQKGHACPADGSDQQRFEGEFPYVESEDQLAAIADVKADLESEKVMERLVCGDVGYGKTEVAMRAAFKMVSDGNRQVVVLVPTTVLATQHYETFVARMKNYPIRVAVLSRFRTPKQVKETLQQIRTGAVDIVIGTHRVVSKDVQFHNLGLVIIDEEQRFGVKAKEYLKGLKQSADCLVLSATPIPRTLHMSLVGARDLSVINTPPDDRLPIQTAVVPDDLNTIRHALLRELTRDGQAFVIHNRVETIFQYADKIRKMVPQAEVVVGHGQMSAGELDEVFHAFKSGEADILVSTTIVENGVDIPNANTMIVDRADRFGLAELYQLRGRVGRWNRRAFAYFLVPKNRALSEIADKRLQALVEAQGRGGGMKIAMRDLEIRGAGDILGLEQSGHVAAIGFHLYCKLLKRTLDTLTGKLPSTLCDTKLEFSLDARLPESYINESSLRMEVYQRLGEASSWEQVDQLYQELRDRFGPPPEQVRWLYHLTRIRVFASLNSFMVVKIAPLSLFAERKKGKKLVQNKVLMKPPKDPEMLEKKVIEALKKKW